MLAKDFLENKQKAKLNMNPFRKKIKSRYLTMDKNGFTLVELMVVVAITGILAGIALPVFKTFQARSKTTEAKVQLGFIYSIQKFAMISYGSYATCLNRLGYNGPKSGNYYLVGFSEDNEEVNDNIIFPNGRCSSHGENESYWVANINVGGKRMDDRTKLLNAIVSDNGNSFIVGAAGYISEEAHSENYSYWTINESKELIQVYKGY